jgi:hypothetical protein
VAGARVKPEYGPTLGEMLSPHWRAASPLLRRVSILAGVGLLVGAVGAALTLENAHFSHAGKVPFHFSYRGLYRTAPDPGGLAKVQRLGSDGHPEDSFAVGPLRLPPYSGGLSGELPLYASGEVGALRHRFPDFVLRGEGKTRVNTVPGYDVLFSARVQGRRMYGRYVLLAPERPHVRDGVTILMLSAPSASVKSPLEVASSGILLRPLKTFTFD